MMAGVTEEIAFRELPISYMARQWRDEIEIPLMVIIPGTAFGLTHLSNIVGSKPFTGSRCRMFCLYINRLHILQTAWQ